MMSSLWYFLRARCLQAGLMGSVAVCAFTAILVSGLFLGHTIDADAALRRILMAGGVGVVLGIGAYVTARR